MSTGAIVNNKISGKDYRISIVPVRKRISIPSQIPKVIDREKFSKLIGMDIYTSISFENIIFEAAIFPTNRFFKPIFCIDLEDGYTKKMSEEEFTDFVHKIVANENIVDIKNGDNDVYKKYGFIVVKHDIWSLFLLSKVRMLFIFKDPNLDKKISYYE